MSARSGNDYLKGLASRSREVWLDGQRVEDVANHPAFRASAQRIAELYDLQLDPANRDTLLYESPTTGDPVGTAFMQPRSYDDLVKRRKAFQAYAEHTLGLMGRSPDFLNTTLMAFAESDDVFARGGERYGRNVTDYYEYVRENDLFLTHALVQPQIDRSKTSHEQQDKFLHLGVVDERPDGIVVQGARMLATLAPVADEIIIFNLPGLRDGDEAHAVAFAVPLDTPGLRLICREPYDRGEASSFDHPLAANFEESDALVVFNEVFVPWERVFLYRNVELCNRMYADSNLRQHTAHQTNVRGLIKMRLATGVAMTLSRSVKTDSFLHVQQMLGEACGYVELINSGIIRSEVEHETTAGGAVRCRFEALQVLRGFLSYAYPRVIEILQTIGAGGLLIVPSEKDFTSEISEDVERYFQGAGGLSAVDRARIYKIASDLTMSAFGSRQVQYERYYAGDPVRLVAGTYLSYDKSACDALVERAMQIAGEPAVPTVT
ncbi:MAG: 4-hydroxyphenylacetate 3-monooxygenase, oxygenase subunit [Conexibacter sp.]|nr:4-hydroxyphenylacetate 3-monooxygenase, oxygenase subunit [Conexibacter sp.]